MWQAPGNCLIAFTHLLRAIISINNIYVSKCAYVDFVVFSATDTDPYLKLKMKINLCYEFLLDSVVVFDAFVSVDSQPAFVFWVRVKIERCQQMGGLSPIKKHSIQARIQYKM